MRNEWYTLGVWRVKPGREEAFVAAWRALGAMFMSLPKPPRPGTLIQSVDDPQQFYSFGPWNSMEDIQEMRANPKAQEGLGRLKALCDESKPGAYRLRATVP